MGVNPKNAGGRSIPKEVNAEQIRKSLLEDHLVGQIVKQGKALLERTNRPNVITWAQFEPFIPMFNMDVARYDAQRPDGPYVIEMNKMFNRWKNELGINLYEITVVIKSREDPTVVLRLNRRYTRIKSDKVEGVSARENIPSNISKTSETNRSQEVLKASIHDVSVANNSPEQLKHFALARMQSAIIDAEFIQKHMSPEKRKELLGDISAETSASVSPSTSEHLVTFADDDDDDD